MIMFIACCFEVGGGGDNFVWSSATVLESNVEVVVGTMGFLSVAILGVGMEYSARI